MKKSHNIGLIKLLSVLTVLIMSLSALNTAALAADKNGNTMAVVTVENQNPEKLDSLKMDGDNFNIDNYGGLLDAHSISITADGKYVYKNSGFIIYKANERIAYIPVIWQINMPKNNLSALNNQIKSKGKIML